MTGPSHQFSENGYCLLEGFSPEASEELRSFAKTWLMGLIERNCTDANQIGELEQYHLWQEKAGVDHGNMLRAANRHCVPPTEIGNLSKQSPIPDFLQTIGCGDYELWDEGLGWLGFRLVRPGFNDGYPLSCKAWGPAPWVISCWIPIIGNSDKETLGLVPGSHLKDYERYLPEDTKFCKNEYRLKGDVDQLNLVRPNLSPSEIVLYHPRTLHTEDVTDSPITRFNLEVRFAPPKDKR